MSGTNIGPWIAMEHWTEKETPSLNHGKQSHWPVGGSGRAMTKKGMKSWGDRDGIKRKVRGSAIMAINARIRASKAAYHAGGKKGKVAK